MADDCFVPQTLKFFIPASEGKLFNAAKHRHLLLLFVRIRWLTFVMSCDFDSVTEIWPVNDLSSNKSPIRVVG